MGDVKIVELPREDGTVWSAQMRASMREGLEDLMEVLQGYPHALQAALVDSLAVSWCMRSASPQEAWDALSAAIGRDLATAQALSG